MSFTGEMTKEKVCVIWLSFSICAKRGFSFALCIFDKSVHWPTCRVASVLDSMPSCVYKCVLLCLFACASLCHRLTVFIGILCVCFSVTFFRVQCVPMCG